MVNKRYRIEPMPDRQYAENISFSELSIKLGKLALTKLGDIRCAIGDKMSQFGYALGVNEPDTKQTVIPIENDEQI